MTEEEIQNQFNSWIRPIPLGSVVKHYGKVVAIGYIGERYHWLDDGQCVSMILGDVVERMFHMEQCH